MNCDEKDWTEAPPCLIALRHWNDLRRCLNEVTTEPFEIISYIYEKKSQRNHILRGVRAQSNTYNCECELYSTFEKV
ncbi:unnamed protein product [Haemonchus placei]|uniref:Uncharacterized protein n=1 Tax=Haemonchus placei TaxID=6290 RepID=A0A0N4WLD2_HAEPC|nr:unnamed protein product [Haemonchus placei]